MDLRINSFEEYKEQYDFSVREPEKFWAGIAENFSWKQKWSEVLKWNFTEPDVKWFLNGKLNIIENCIDRHLQERGEQIAFYWEPNDPSEENRSFTYNQLYLEVCRFSNVLKSNGVQKGDRVCIYMPMIPELMIAVLSCARIGAVHSVVFGGFSANALAGRIQDSECELVITSDGSYRGAKKIPMKSVVDEAIENCPTVLKVIVCKRTGENVSMKSGRDLWWEEEMKKAADFCEPEIMDSEDLLYILYTSGSTGKPKGVVHTIAGYMVFTAYTFQNVFQYDSTPAGIHPKGGVYWCTADIGWVTGHSYIVYAPLLCGATSVMFEGIPTYPDPERFWKVIEKYKVNIFYTAPTAVRALEACGLQHIKPYKMESLRVLGSVGEPINAEAWDWMYKNIGKEKCPVVDTWWQTETAGIMISPIAGITPLKPCYATLPLPGVQPLIVDEKGEVIEGNNVEGNLCIAFPWPGIVRTTYGDHERCRKSYFATYKNLYFTGDGCKRDENGYYRITGRVDDVINVSGHRIGTAEVENAINEHPDIVESAVVAFPHEIKGQAIYAYVITISDQTDIEKLRRELNEIVSKMIGPIAKPDKIQIVSGLPKTRSGKIMRRILRKIAEGDFSNLGDISTLMDPEIVEQIKNGRQ